MYAAGTTCADATTKLCAGQLELFADDPEERGIRIRLDRQGLTVDLKIYGHKLSLPLYLNVDFKAAEGLGTGLYAEECNGARRSAHRRLTIAALRNKLLGVTAAWADKPAIGAPRGNGRDITMGGLECLRGDRNQ